MSSRALRKLQREREQQAPAGNESGSDGDETLIDTVSVPKKINAFDMLNAEEEDEGHEEANPLGTDEDSDHLEDTKDVNNASSAVTGKSNPKKSKKKKKKSKAKNKATDADSNEQTGTDVRDEQLDEIDLALKALSTKADGKKQEPILPTNAEFHAQLHRLLAVESKHLNALNEMKRLFGKIVLEAEEDTQPSPRRRGRGPQQVDLGAALTARHSPVSNGQGLSGPALRRNFFIQGKEEWPKATGGGLGMELVEKLEDGTIEYRFVHSAIYQDTQRQFEACVESMDSQRMITMLVFNPYHVSTLLQVSEIAKQQGDHSVSADLLERALFTFGRSVSSSFTSALSEGKARLDFRRPENREFWLAAWRYMINLGQKGTWRTAYEWAKLILSLEPESDPYCVANVLDQLAIRGGQLEHFLELSGSEFYRDDIWNARPNINISAALAENRLKKAQQSRDSLRDCVERFPWIFARLFQELNIDRIPKGIWGSSPRTEAEKLDCEAYVHNAKDLWNTPEGTTFLVEVAEEASPAKAGPEDDREISLDEARFALLLGAPSIIQCVPRSLYTEATSASDPLPPLDNLPSYNPSMPPGQGFDAVNHYDSDMYSDEEVTSGDEEDSGDRTASADPSSRIRPGQRATQNDRPSIIEALNRYMPWLNGTDRTPTEEAPSSLPESSPPTTEPERAPSLLPTANDDPSETSPTVPSDDDENPPLIVDITTENRRLRSWGNHANLGNLAGLALPALPSSSPPPTITPTPPQPILNPLNWLAGTGLLALSAYTKAHGLDPAHWPSSSPASAPASQSATAAAAPNPDLAAALSAAGIPDDDDDGGHTLLRQYATRLARLPRGGERSREGAFLMEYRIPQGAGDGVKELVKREVDIVKRSGVLDEG